MLAVREVLNPKDRKTFVLLPWKANRGDRNFVPPIIADEMKLCDPDVHPFWKDGSTGRFFLAERDGQPVGRIAAIRNPRYEAFAKEPAAFFGFFDCVETGQWGEETTRALVAKVRECVAGWNLPYFYGPASPSCNYLFGTLVEGHQFPPRIMMAYNPPGYDALLKTAGLVKAKDLLAHDIPVSNTYARIRKVADRIQQRHRVTLRNFNLKDFDREVGLMKTIFDDVWSENWGYVPMSDAEFALMGKEMKQIVDPDFVVIAEIDGQAVGFSLTLPDANEALISKWVNGRPLTPWGLSYLLGYTMVWPKIRYLRVLALGTRKEYRTLGLGTLFYCRTFEMALKKGYHGGEASWVLEDNLQMNAALKAMGAIPNKRYRIYRGEA